MILIERLFYTICQQKVSIDNNKRRWLVNNSKIFLNCLIMFFSLEFFFPDDSHTFWADLKQVTNENAWFRRLPNAEHMCVGHEFSILDDLVGFYINIYEVSYIL
jgi:hypothetical protein